MLRVTILKNEKRKSRGVAFIQFSNASEAEKCIELDNTQVKQAMHIHSTYRIHNLNYLAIVSFFQMFGRTLKMSIVKDNGRSGEFSNKRIYADKQRCYECGEEGHLSYKCPVNVLGNRDIPSTKSNNNKRYKQPGAVNEWQATASSAVDVNRCSKDVSTWSLCWCDIIYFMTHVSISYLVEV